jgi:hypothetical protein
MLFAGRRIDENAGVQLSLSLPGWRAISFSQRSLGRRPNWANSLVFSA